MEGIRNPEVLALLVQTNEEGEDTVKNRYKRDNDWKGRFIMRCAMVGLAVIRSDVDNILMDPSKIHFRIMMEDGNYLVVDP